MAFLLLGLTSFGGPVAHLGYFREALVVRRRWLSEEAYAELVALCQFLPGPASSQVGIAIGLLRAGHAGAVAAWTAFTLPSVLLLLAFAYGLGALGGSAAAGALSGLKLAALAVVAQAVWAMAVSLTPDRERRLVALAAAVAVLVVATNLAQMAVIALAAVAGALRPATAIVTPDTGDAIPRRGQPWLWLGLFVALLIGLPLLVALTGDATVMVFEKFYRTGSLVFGGGHVVLPLLEAELVQPGLIGSEAFIAGYGAAQAVPGPLFAFAAYAGAMLEDAPNGLWGAALALVAIYLPSFFLVFGTLPLWQRLRTRARLRGALDFANAAVVGLLVAVLYDPVFLSAVDDGADLALALVAFALLALLRWPPWLVVVLSAAAGYLLAAL
jgi:chromate transporter